MNPAFLDDMSWEMAEVYGAITDQILINLARHFPFYEYVSDIPTSSFAYQTKMLAQMWQINRETIQIIRNTLEDADLALQGVLEQSVIDAVRSTEPDLLEAVKAGIFKPAGIPAVSPNQYRAFQLYYGQAAEKLNLVNTVMLESTRSAYQQAVSGVVAEIDLANRMNRTQIALDTAAGETITGVSSWNQAMRHAAERLTNGGIVGFIDHAGRQWSAEAYVAMDIRTTVFNTARAAVWETNQNFGNDLYSVSYHDGARPLCYPWQNKVISSTDHARVTYDLDGNEIPVYRQSDTTYGQPAGLFGINCKHYPTPFIPSVSVIDGKVQDKETNDEQYAQSQEQRRLERKIREQKRDLQVMKDQGRPEEEIAAQREKIKQTSSDIDSFCRETGRARHRDREGVYTRREFPDADKYDVSKFEHQQKDAIDKYFSNGGEQQGFTFGEMTTKVPIIPAIPITPIVPAQTPTTPVTPVEGQATDKFVTEYLPARGITEVPVQMFDTQPTEQEIISSIAGADRTKGSCVSVAFSYVGNQGGYDVHDFRGGISRDIFSMNINISKVAQFKGVDGIIENTVNDYSGAHKVLKHVESGHQYFLRTGKHAAIVRQGVNGIEYLEMQSGRRANTWYELTDAVLDWRFGCQKSHSTYGMRYGLDNVLIDVDKLKRSPDFVEMLKFINTAVGAQQKGVGGGIK